ncbi:MAG: alpha/beta hydrolase [Bryobacterales bacterium]|nr:alpha/beta hydrolase [Bryobacterales bacterium]
MHLLGILTVSAWALCAQTHPITGDWAGTLQAGGDSLRLALHIQDGPEQTYRGTLDSLSQGAKGLPLASVTRDGAKVRFEVPSVGGKYEGTLSADGLAMEGEWSQGVALPLTFRRGPAAEVRRTQVPQGPFPYEEIEVMVANPQADAVKLACTLTVPKQGRPAPAVVLITGSGSQNRDEEIAGHKPFLVLADHLSRNGMAVLRCDDRGYAKSSGTAATATTMDLATDAEAQVAFLKTRSEVSARHIGLIGHSEGGLIAPIVASRNAGVAFVVLLAGTSVPGREIILEQVQTLTRLNGMNEGAIQMALSAQTKVLDIVESEPDDAAALEKLSVIAPPNQARLLVAPWYRAFLKLDPAPYLRQTKVPLLALFGELDRQVLPGQNIPPLVKALEDGHHADYTVAKLPKLNHLFQTATTGGPGEYGSIEETIAPLALETITRWIQQHTK